jgi:hypothetical protein
MIGVRVTKAAFAGSEPGLRPQERVLLFYYSCWKKSAMKLKISSLLSIVTAVFVCAPFAQAQYQTQNNNYGVSGGNVNDISKAFCCSGTLGSLVAVGNTNTS